MAIKNKFNTNGSTVGFKNRIIGGDFSTNPWQRGTSYAIGTTSHVNGPDKLHIGNSTSGTVTATKDADAPTVAQAGVFTQHCVKINVDTVTTPSTAQFIAAYTDIEDYLVKDVGFGQSGVRYVTFSFWIKSNKTGIYCAAFRNATNDRSYVTEFTINASATWEKKIITIPVDTTGTWSYGSATTGVQVIITAGIGPTYVTGLPNSWQTGNLLATANTINLMSAANNYLKLALLQFEVGNQATAFETRSVQQELALCQRYHCNISHFTGFCSSTTDVQASIQFPVEMRGTPTLGITGPQTIIDGTANYTQSSAVIANISTDTKGATLYVRNFTGLTNLRSVVSNNAGNFITATAEI